MIGCPSKATFVGRAGSSIWSVPASEYQKPWHCRCTGRVQSTRGAYMVKTTVTLLGAGLLSLAISGPVHAQEVATLVLQNGERPSGELVDLNASGFTLKVSGQNRQFAKTDVRAIEFVVGALAADAQAKVNAGQPLVILRSGQ